MGMTLIYRIVKTYHSLFSKTCSPKRLLIFAFLSFNREKSVSYSFFWQTSDLKGKKLKIKNKECDKRKLWKGERKGKLKDKKQEEAE
jgi:hypothetical protein